MSLPTALFAVAAALLLAGCPTPPEAPQGGKGPAANAGQPGPKATPPPAGGGAPPGGDAPAGAPGAGGPGGDAAPQGAAGAPPPPGDGPAPAAGGGGAGAPPPAADGSLGGFVPTTANLPSFSKDLKNGGKSVTLTFELTGADSGQIDISLAKSEQPSVLHIQPFEGTSTVVVIAPASLTDELQAAVLAYGKDGRITGGSEPVNFTIAGEDATFQVTVKDQPPPKDPAKDAPKDAR
jgi:hypothetical protein